tara:strand:+ start:1895 stop:2146 length:252 start_codon:yes stop_codon:yes gene_type:complete
MPIVENFTNQFLNNEEEGEVEGVIYTGINLGPMLPILLICLRLLFIYIILLIWPRVMPKIFTGIKGNPTYLQLLGLSVIITLI